MITIFDFLRSDIAADLSVALLHTLWQGLVITLILFLALKSIPGNRSQWRYRLSIVSLLVIVLCWLGTFSILQYEPAVETEAATTVSKAIAITDSPETADPTAVSNINTAVAIKTVRQSSNNTTDSKAASLGFGWFIVLWSAGVLAMLIRMFAALAGTAKLKRDAVDITDNALVELFENLCARMNITQKIRFAASKTLQHPGVIGFWRPVLLIPVSILNEVSAEYLEVIIAHELAHIRRYDYLINFCQMFIEAIFFFNPAVWWISRQIRIEREACCDIAGVESTGRRIGYAQVLLDQLSRTATQIKPAMTAAITGFSDDNGSSSAERVRRIIHPQYKPCMKIGWAKLTLLLAVSGVALLGLWKTADITIAMAAKIMTPQQRVEKIAEIKKEYAPDYDAPATIEISGKVSTFDGAHPKDWSVSTVSGHTHTSIGRSGCNPDPVPKTTFKGKIYPGKSYLYAVCHGYAPFITELEMGLGDSLEGLEIIFDHGFDSKIKVVDQDGKGIAGAAISGNFTANNSTFGNGFKAVSGDDGIAVCEKMTDWLMSVKVIAPGYQKVEGYKVELEPDEVEIIVLSKGTPAAGTVVSSKTGEPVANAEFRIIYKYKPGHSYGYGIRTDVAAVSNDEGAFILDTLEAGASYIVMVSSPDHRNTFVSNIGPGNMDLKIELDPAVVVNATITGDLSKISKGWHTVDGESVRGLQINVNCILKKVRGMYNDFSGMYNDFKYYPVKIEDGVGYVHIANAIGSRLDFKIDGKTVYKLDIIDGKSQYDITMDTAGLPEREVVVTFTAGEGMPLPEGKSWVFGRPDGDSEWFSRHAKVENGIAKFKVPAPCKMNVNTNSQDKLTGYWFAPVKDIEVDDSDEPFELELKVKPGGTIFGDVYDAQGNKLSGANMHIQLVNDIKGLDASVWSHISDLGYDAGRSGSYSAMSLPFGGKYKFEATHENYVMLSPAIKITEKKPIVQYDFKKGSSISLKGQILKHDSSAAARVDYQLYRSSKLSSGSLGKMKTVNKNGEFVIEGINPDVKVDYSLKVFDKETGRQEKFKLKCTKRSQKLKLPKPI